MNGNCGMLSRIFLACPTTVPPNGPNTISPPVGVVVILQIFVLGLHTIVHPPDELHPLDEPPDDPPEEEPPDEDQPPGIVHCAVHVNHALPLLVPASHTSCVPSALNHTTPSPQKPGVYSHAAEETQLFSVIGVAAPGSVLTKHFGTESVQVKLAVLLSSVPRTQACVGRYTVFPSTSVPHLIEIEFALSFQTH